MASNRIGRINEEIQRELAEQLRRLKDPRVSQVGMVSITRVDTTGDLRYSKVYISVLDKDQEKDVLKVLRDPEKVKPVNPDNDAVLPDEED